MKPRKAELLLNKNVIDFDVTESIILRNKEDERTWNIALKSYQNLREAVRGHCAIMMRLDY